MQYQYFQHASRSRLELGECLQAGCLQRGDEEFKHGGEAYSLNNLLREAEDGLEDAVSSFAKLKSAWVRYTATVSMFLSVQYEIIMIKLLAVFLKYGMQCLLGSAVCSFRGPVWSSRQKMYPKKPRSTELEPIMKNTSNIHNGVSAPC